MTFGSTTFFGGQILAHPTLGVCFRRSPSALAIVCEKLLPYKCSNEQNYMARDYMLRIRLNTQELERLKAVAQKRQLSMSEVIRDYIKRMPKK